MEIRNLKPGQRAALHTKQGDFECVVLESPQSGIILIKLDSGYNIGIREEEILDIKIIKEEKEKRGSEEEIKIEKNLPNVALVSTGGTISSRLDYKTGAVKWLTNPKELLKFYPELFKICNIARIETPFMKASENMGPEDWEIISEKVAEMLNDNEIDGVIVTHGTDFLHYTASALAFSLGKIGKPVAITYSQRSSDRGSSDARLNLVCAARFAVSDIADVALIGHANSGDEYCYALPATKSRKMHSSRRDTFRAINAKPIAKIYPDRIELIDKYNPRDDKIKINAKSKFSAKAALVKFYPNQNPDILDYYINQGYKGIVVEASGLGHVITEGKNNWIPKLKKVIKSGFVVCAAPQTIYGELQPYVYSAGRELEKTGIIYLKDILPETALVKLSWVLANPALKKDIRESMLNNFAREFNPRISEDEFL